MGGQIRLGEEMISMLPLPSKQAKKMQRAGQLLQTTLHFCTARIEKVDLGNLVIGVKHIKAKRPFGKNVATNSSLP